MKLEKYLSEESESMKSAFLAKMEARNEEEENLKFSFSPQQIKNLKIYVLGMEDSKRHISLKRGITKLNLNKHLNADEAGSVKDFCLDVLDSNTAKFKSLMG
jgi:hypothetical protein